MNPKLGGILLDVAYRRDIFETDLGRTLDIKASILLVVIVFLATLSSNMIFVQLGFYIRLGQFFSIGLLSIATVLAIAELWPRDYQRENMPELWEAWIADLEKLYEGQAEKETRVLGETVRGRAERAKERVIANRRINETKSHLLFRSFRFTVLSMAIELMSLIVLSFKRPL